MDDFIISIIPDEAEEVPFKGHTIEEMEEYEKWRNEQDEIAERTARDAYFKKLFPCVDAPREVILRNIADELYNICQRKADAPIILR